MKLTAKVFLIGRWTWR